MVFFDVNLVTSVGAEVSGRSPVHDVNCGRHGVSVDEVEIMKSKFYESFVELNRIIVLVRNEIV